MMATGNIQATGRMVEMQVSGLAGHALNWAVFCAIYKGMQPTINVVEASAHKLPGAAKAMQFPRSVHLSYTGAYDIECRWNPQGDWEQGGPLISTHHMDLCCEHPETIGAAICDDNGMYIDGRMMFGKTHLIAACRAIVAAHLGEVVSVPAELVSPDEK